MFALKLASPSSPPSLRHQRRALRELILVERHVAADHDLARAHVQHAVSVPLLVVADEHARSCTLLSSFLRASVRRVRVGVAPPHAQVAHARLVSGMGQPQPLRRLLRAHAQACAVARVHGGLHRLAPQRLRRARMVQHRPRHLHDGAVHALRDAVVLRRVRQRRRRRDAVVGEEGLQLTRHELAAAVGVELHHRHSLLHRRRATPVHDLARGVRLALEAEHEHLARELVDQHQHVLAAAQRFRQRTDDVRMHTPQGADGLDALRHALGERLAMRLALHAAGAHPVVLARVRPQSSSPTTAPASTSAFMPLYDTCPKRKCHNCASVMPPDATASAALASTTRAFSTHTPPSRGTSIVTCPSLSRTSALSFVKSTVAPMSQMADTLRRLVLISG